MRSPVFFIPLQTPGSGVAYHDAALFPGKKAVGKFPTLAIDPADVLVRIQRIRAAQVHRVPFQLLAQPISHIPQMIGLGQPPGVFEIAGGRFARLATIHPFALLPW